MEQGEVRRNNEQERGNGYALEMGQLRHKHGELVDSVYWFLTFSFWFYFNFPLPRSTKGRKTSQQWVVPY